MEYFNLASASIVILISEYTDLQQKSPTEWAGPCPLCGGEDRFIVWPKETGGRYWCRQCERKGDETQFCVDFLGMTMADALRATGKGHKLSGTRPTFSTKASAVIAVQRPVNPAQLAENSLVAEPKAKAELDRDIWQTKAQDEMRKWQGGLLNNPELMDWLEKDRGLAAETVRHWKLGYQPNYYVEDRTVWGFAPDPTKSDKNKLWFQPGLVIPHLRPDGNVSGINIRQFKTTDAVPQRYRPFEEPQKPYKRVRGTQSYPWVLAELHPITGLVIVVESELDALLLWQYLDLYVTPVALLTAGAKPAPGSLPPGPVMFALDMDNAGKGRFPWWQQHHNALPAPPIKGKDISDMVRNGVDLLAWLSHILKRHNLVRPDVLNPYAHFSLLAGPGVPVQGRLPAHIWREGTAPDGIVARWLQASHDPALRWQLELQYQRLWGLNP